MRYKIILLRKNALSYKEIKRERDRVYEVIKLTETHFIFVCQKQNSKLTIKTSFDNRKCDSHFRQM